MPPKPSTRPRLSPLLRMMIGALLSLIVLVGLIVLIAWLVVQPRKLKYTIEQGSISGYNLTRNDILNANFQFVLRLNNPNRRISVYYDKIDATMSYDGQDLSTNDLRPFYQPTGNVTHLDLYLTPKETALYREVAQYMRMGQAAGKIVVDVTIRARIRIKIGIFKFHKKLNVCCESVTLPFNPSKGFERVYCDVEIDD